MGEKEIGELIAIIEEEEYLSEEQAFSRLESYLKTIIAVYMQLINELPNLKAQGIVLPEEIILQQVRNLNEAIEYKDLILLRDTMKYEVINVLQVYREIRMGMVEE